MRLNYWRIIKAPKREKSNEKSFYFFLIEKFKYNYFAFLRYSLSTSNAGESSPWSLMTTQEHPTTFLAFPVLSILQRPAHSPSFLLLSTLIMGI